MDWQKAIDDYVDEFRRISQISGDDPLGQQFLGGMKTGMSAGVRIALEAAAKEVCPHCAVMDRGVSRLVVTEEGLTHEFNVGNPYKCLAYKVHRLLADLEKEND